MADLDGTFDERFRGVRNALAATLDSGLDIGASVAVALDGELVVDLWGGWADEAAGTEWERDTITNVWSTTKTMAALCALILADRGELDVESPVARYWPEFKAAGKEAVEVRHLLGHTSGLSGWQERMRPEDLYDWEKATSVLAAQEPWWEPGTASGYHAFTQGYLVGEVVRRITGQTIGTFFASEVAGPLGADFHIGLDAAHDPRVSKVIAPPKVASNLEPTSIAMRTLSNPPLSAEQSWESDWRRAEIPAAGGHGNARSVAMVQSALACGGEVGGVRLLSA
jgi:CubicO group peptidase (beta-lactamase class C family)